MHLGRTSWWPEYIEEETVHLMMLRNQREGDRD
jgi:hypothetical protein